MGLGFGLGLDYGLGRGRDRVRVRVRGRVRGRVRARAGFASHAAPRPATGDGANGRVGEGPGLRGQRQC